MRQMNESENIDLVNKAINDNPIEIQQRDSGCQSSMIDMNQDDSGHSSNILFDINNNNLLQTSDYNSNVNNSTSSNNLEGILSYVLSDYVKLKKENKTLKLQLEEKNKAIEKLKLAYIVSRNHILYFQLLGSRLLRA